MPNRQLSMTRFSMRLRWPRTSRQLSSVSCDSPEPVRCRPRRIDTVGLQLEHRALVAGVDGDLACPIDGQRLVEHHGAGIDARRRLQHRAGGRRIDQLLEGLEAVHALVALVQHELRFGPVDIDARRVAHVGRRADLWRLDRAFVDAAPAELAAGLGRDQQCRYAQRQQRQQGADRFHSAVPSRICLRRSRMASASAAKVTSSSA